MEKEFFDVFPNLKLKQELSELLEEVIVTKVACNSAKTCVRVYLKSDRWIHKKHIFSLEEQIQRQCFPGLEVSVKVIEKFHLSRQYTPKNFLDTYRSSMELELRNYNMLEYNLFKQAQITFPEDDCLNMALPDSVISRQKSEILIEYLHKVFCERCGMDLKVSLDYVQTEESRYRKNAAIQIRQEVANVLKHARLSTEEESAAPAPAAEEKTGKEAAAGKTSAARSEKKAEAASEKKPFEKKPFEKKGKWGDFRGGFRKDPNPDVIYGRDFEDEPIPLENIVQEMGEVIIRCQVMDVEAREIRNEKTILIFPVTDFTDSITVKMFLRNEQVPEIKEHVKKGAFLKIKGVTSIDRFDGELTIGSISGIKKISDFRSYRVDTSPQKRVELHCHTKMSDMDGVTEAKALVKRAYEWGHPAIAITDHGVVQAFPEANHCFDAWGGCVPKDSDFKVLYGMEAYLVDDLKGMVTNPKKQSLDGRFVVFDIETTGFSPLTCKIIEIGAVLVENGKITDRFSTFVNPQVPIPFRIEQLTSINDSMVMNARPIEEILPEFLKFCEGATMVAHNADFDMSFIIENCNRMGIPNDFTYVDTVGMARFLLPALNRFKLDTVAKAVGVSLDHHHRAVDDAECTARIFEKFVGMCRERDITDVDKLNEQGKVSPDTIKKLPTYHAVIFMRNETGRINLYKLVSQSHIKYFNHRPRVPKSLFEAHREGLLIGSACEAGELYQALLRNAPEQEIARLVSFYDYLEIQPLGNNMFMVEDEKNDTIHSKEDLIEINKKIVKLGEQFNKPVVATCDVHFMDPQDEIYRRIIMAGSGFKDADNQAPLYLRTTEEMLEEFSYLGSEKAEEVVITNTVKIADMIEKMSPIHPDKYPPVIENSDQDLKDMCFQKAHEMYGEVLPKIVEDRLDKELNSIISNGYAVMYIIAQKLVWKSNADGYLVGSRGSVGSSLAATMSGITEVNPLPPHYLCPNPECKYSDFDSPEIKAFSGMAGCDMPDRICPKCGTRMTKQGFDIPFETFLGFKGDKEPDIDLNFSGMYQSHVHRYTEELFGKENVFKAGTVSGLQDKTAYGYVKKYLEERGKTVNRAEENRLVMGCTGVKRTTGQHPGGMVVVPDTFDIYDFCAIQHPADDVKGGLLTTHFEFKYLHDTLLKLDELGHDVPTFYKFFEEYSGIPIDSVPMNDEKVYSLLTSPEALGVTEEQIGSKTGTFGIPEMGTNFVRQMLLDAQPKNFSELIQISGLSHGTDVWTGNADELIRSGTCTIAEVIGCRDSIMLYLLRKGLEPKMSFDIMEAVRKGKVAKGGFKPGWEEAMREHDVPDWYIESCRKIKYMFPKAHAVAYLMAAIRLMWFKVYHPAIFYAVYFTVRGADIDYEAAVGGVRVAKQHLRDNEKIPKDERTAKDDDALVSLQLENEMLQRGCEFLPIELGRSYASKYVVEDGKVRLPFTAIRGLGDAAAVALEQATMHGQEYISVEELQQASGVAQSVFDKLRAVGALGSLPETSQVDLFSMI